MNVWLPKELCDVLLQNCFVWLLAEARWRIGRIKVENCVIADSMVIGMQMIAGDRGVINVALLLYHVFIVGSFLQISIHNVSVNSAVVKQAQVLKQVKQAS